MVRARLARLTVAGGLLLATGCSTTPTTSMSSPFSFFHRSRPETVIAYPVGSDCCDFGCPTPCYPAPGCTTGCGPGPLVSNAHPPIMDGPSLFPQGPTPVPFPGVPMPQLAPRPGLMPPVTAIPPAMMSPSPP